MATFNKVNDFVVNAVHNMDLASDQVVVALSNTALASESSNPSTDGNGVLANVTQITYTNLSTRDVTTSSSTQSGGTYKLVLADITLTSTGGATGPFRYVYIYDDTVTVPADPLIGYYDYGSSLTLNDGDSLTVDFSAANGVLQIA
tara:strand:- start:696 stop:1133 length:438 start_codon:yes stop_codon:yes gene_type:complete